MIFSWIILLNGIIIIKLKLKKNVIKTNLDNKKTSLFKFDENIKLNFNCKFIKIISNEESHLHLRLE